MNLGLGFTSRYPDPLLGDREDLDTVIEDVAKGAAAEAEKTSARGAVEDATEGPGVEAGKATTEEAGKGPAGEAGKAAAEEEVVNDQPSSSIASSTSQARRAPGLPSRERCLMTRCLPPPGSR